MTNAGEKKGEEAHSAAVTTLEEGEEEEMTFEGAGEGELVVVKVGKSIETVKVM